MKTQQDIINENIIEQLQIRIEQDIKQIESLQNSLDSMNREVVEMNRHSGKMEQLLEDFYFRRISSGEMKAKICDVLNLPF